MLVADNLLIFKVFKILFVALYLNDVRSISVLMWAGCGHDMLVACQKKPKN